MVFLLILWLGKTFHRLGWLYSAVAIHDPTPVHVILGYTLGHIASLRGLEEPPQAIEHKSKAIKLLNHRMADPKQSYSDELIGAIVNFAGWEVKVSYTYRISRSDQCLAYLRES